MKEKIFTILFMLIASIGIVRAEFITIDGITYEFIRGGSSASVYSGKDCSGHVAIPSMIDAYQKGVGNNIEYVKLPVTNIRDGAFEYCGNLTSITLPNSILNIGDAAFWYCSSLTSVTIPNSVTSIGNHAFIGCSSLTAITIPNSVTKIGNRTFCGCSSLTSVTIPNSVTSIGSSAFKDCSSLTAIIIPNSVTSIGSSAFKDCSNLTSVIIPNSVTSIDEYAFCGCISITSVIIGNNVTSIGDVAFENCTSLVYLEIPKSITSMGTGVFWGCNNLSEVHFNGNIEDWLTKKWSLYYATSPGSSPSSAYYDLYLKDVKAVNIIIPSSITNIKDHEFYHCSSLVTIAISNSVTSIGEGAFSGCPNLASVTIDNGVTSIERGTFRNCTTLMSVIIPSSVTSIGEDAFRACNNLTYVTIPNSVTSIGDNAFSGCSSLISIDIPDNVVNLGSYAFFDCQGLKSIHIGEGVFEMIFSFVGCNTIESIVWDAVNCQSAPSGTNYYSTFYDSRSSIKSFVFGDKVEYIPEGLCCHFSAISSIIIPQSVKRIANHAFAGCLNLGTVIIGESTTQIGEYAFDGCSNLSIIYNKANTPQPIEGNVFESVNKSTCRLKVPAESYALYKSAPVWRDFLIETDTISVCIAGYGMCGNGLGWIVSCDSSVLTITGIGDMMAEWELNEAPWYPFKDSIEYIFLPKGITSLGNYAFRGCSNVKEITCNALTPPTCGTAVFSDIDKTIPLHLPDASIDLYKVADQWEDFFSHEGPAPCITAYGKCGDDLAWKINCDKTELEIIGSGDMYNYDWNTSPWYSYRTLIRKIHLSEKITSIGQYAFYGCSAVDTIVVPDSVTTIAVGAFMACSGLQYCQLGNHVAQIGSDAFYGCSSIVSMDVPASVMSIAEGSMPKGNLAGVNVADGNSYYCSIDGILFNKNLSLLHTYPSAKENATYAIPESVHRIGKGAFSNSKLRYVSMPNNVLEIGSSAFAYCYYLDSINLPASIEMIGNYAFNYCSYLQSVRCEAIIPPTCGTNIFYNVNVENIPLYAPAESLTAYATTEPWRNFSPIIPVGQTGSTNNGITVRLNPQSCSTWSVVRLWAWTANGNLFDAWPGIIINQDEDGWYSYTFDESLESVNIIWTDGTNQTIDINGVTESTCYSLNSTTGKYITVTIEQCPVSNPTDIEAINGDAKCPTNKILHDGQLYILRGDKIYTITGQEVK